MSVVPQDQLRPVNSLELKTFEIKQALDNATAPIRFDGITLYNSFWRSVVIRNFNDTDAVYYRESNGVPFDIIPPLAERTILGWGSYLEISKDAIATFRGIVIYELVKASDAFAK